MAVSKHVISVKNFTRENKKKSISFCEFSKLNFEKEQVKMQSLIDKASVLKKQIICNGHKKSRNLVTTLKLTIRKSKQPW